jgi:hypothetical protein
VVKQGEQVVVAGREGEVRGVSTATDQVAERWSNAGQMLIKHL